MSKHIDMDPISGVFFPRIHSTSQCGVMRLVSIFFGAKATTLGPGAGSIACGSTSAIVPFSQETDLHVFKQNFLSGGLKNRTPLKKLRKKEHDMKSSTKTFAMKLKFYSGTAL